MNPASGSLAEQIKGEISADGPMPFACFMERCLYTPNTGYYTGPREKIGREGDFFTSLDVHPVFGALIGAQVIEMGRHLGEGPFTVVERYKFLRLNRMGNVCGIFVIPGGMCGNNVNPSAP